MSYLDATRRAVAVGKSFAFAMGLFGLLLFPGGVWLMLIAVYLYFVASEEEKATIVSVSLEATV
jgi:Zn-dependent protease